MNLARLQLLLRKVQTKKITIVEAVDRLRTLPYENLGYASVDHHRELRQGFPEAILCEGKTTSHILGIARSTLKKGLPLLATRVEPKIAHALKRLNHRIVYHQTARMAVFQPTPRKPKGDIIIITAGTADIPTAEEAKITASVMGSQVETVYDIGVAGMHRLFDHLGRIRRARVLVVVAGMDGVLPSVVSGLVDQPIIAIPTSQGYGAHLGGLAPLLTMLNACSGGVGVVNIDNGFGAGCLAHRINILSLKN